MSDGTEKLTKTQIDFYASSILGVETVSSKLSTETKFLSVSMIKEKDEGEIKKFFIYFGVY